MREIVRRTKIVIGLLAVLVLAGLQTPPHAQAKPPFLTAFAERYPTSTSLFTCGTCHYDFNGPQDDLVAAIQETEILNPFGRAFSEAGGQDDADSALADIESADSDGDGTANGAEIMTLSGFMPGYDCESYALAVNAPANLAFLVDPTFVGCGETTTALPVTTTLAGVTTTLPQETTAPPPPPDSSTTTMLAGPARCAQPRSSGSLPTASDCLLVLRAALGSSTCSPACICAPKGSLPVTATDALICLKRAIGQNTALHCPCDGATTTTMQTTTTLREATTTEPVPTTTTVTSTTTTTLGGSLQVGEAIYDARCATCHIAGAHDKSGFAPDLKGKGGLLVNNLASISPMMAGITLTNQQIRDLAAFFGSL